MPRLWHKGEDFVKNGANVPLLFRMATVADVKPPKGTKVSRYLWKQPSARKVRARVNVKMLTFTDTEMLFNFPRIGFLRQTSIVDAWLYSSCQGQRMNLVCFSDLGMLHVLNAPPRLLWRMARASQLR